MGLGADFDVLRILRWLRPSARWVEPIFGIALFILGFAASAFIIPPVGFPNSGWLNVNYLLAPLILVLWIVIREAYFRTGDSPKIGLVYEAFGVEEPHVQKVRETLASLRSTGELKDLMSLRFFPKRAIRHASKIESYMKRYGLSVLFHIGQSKKVDSEQPHFKIKWSGIQKTANPKLVDTMVRTFLATRQAKQTPCISILEVLESHAASLHDLILMAVTTHCLLNHNYEDAAALLRYVERRMPTKLGPGSAPRLVLRELDAIARIKQCHFASNNVPDPTELNRILTIAETTECYSNEFPWVASHLARIRFYCGNSDAAISLIDDCIEKSVAGKNDVYVLLAKAFLDFYSLRWNRSFDYFQRVLIHPNVFMINWKDDLVPFANYAAGIRVEGAQVLQVLYGRLANTGSISSIEREAFAWIDADSSRKKFRHLLQRALEVWTARFEGGAESKTGIT